VIDYLNRNEYSSLSNFLIEELSNEFVNNLSFLSKNEYNDQKNVCQKMLSIFINKPKEHIIIELSKYVDLWDNYLLSLLYFKILNNIIKNEVMCKKYYFLSEIINILRNNISINPNKRETLEKTRDLINEII
jgi:hypothetical protein